MASILPENAMFENDIDTTARRFFSDLGICKLMRNSNFKKTKGASCFQIFRFIFLLVFTGKNLYRTLQLHYDEMPFAKDCVYRFLNNCHYNWKKLLFLIAQNVVHNYLSPLTSEQRLNVLIIDDSAYRRNRSKKVELLSRFKDHVENRYYKGFRMLTLGWSDGNSFVPLSFTHLASKEQKQLCKIDPSIDKRSIGYRRRKESVQKSTDALLHLLEQAKLYNFPAKHLLFDSWFAFPSIIVKVKERYGLHTVCMLKDLPNNKYTYKKERLTLGELHQKVEKRDCKEGVFASAVVGIGPNKDSEPLKARIIFIKDRNHKKEWLALLSTDLELPEEEIVRIYGKRWDIELFFKTTKSFLNLAKEFQGKSYDSMVAHTSIVFIRYMMLSLESRNSTDARSLGDLFFYCCEEIKDITLIESLRRILVILKDFLHRLPLLSEQVVDDLMIKFFNSLPSYFKCRLGFSMCES